MGYIQGALLPEEATRFGQGVGMASYASKLSILGFVLLAWSVYGLVHFFGFVGLRPPWIWVSLSLLGVLRLGVATFLLRRLAHPAPAGKVVRGLALVCVILGLCSLGLSFWIYWQMFSNPGFLKVYFSNLNHLSNVRSLVSQLAGLVFLIGSLPPLWVLSKQSRPGPWGGHYPVQG